SYLFKRKGIFSINESATDEDTLLAIALEAGAEDMRRSGHTFNVTCDPSVFNQVQEALKKHGLTPEVSEISQIPDVAVDVDLETARKVVRLMDALDDQDDVQNVYVNANIPEEAATEVAKS